MEKTPASTTAASTELMIRRRRNALLRRRTAAYASDRSTRGTTGRSPVGSSPLNTICRSRSTPATTSVTLARYRTRRAVGANEGGRGERRRLKSHRVVRVGHHLAVDL